MPEKITAAQREEILQVYLSEGQSASAALCARYGVGATHGRYLASARRLAPVWRRVAKPQTEKPVKTRVLPSQAQLREKLAYDPETGIFTFLNSGKVAGANCHGYIRIHVAPGFQAPAHRLAWIYMTGVDTLWQIDHKDRDRSNNRWSNLREATNGQNQANAALKSNNKSGFKGVCWCKRTNKWRATVKSRGIQYDLGRFARAEDAHAAYVEASKNIHGEFARSA